MMRSVVLLLLVFSSSRARGEQIERIEECGVRCSQGLPCDGSYQISLQQCKTLSGGVTSDVFSNTSISTVMKCSGKQRCSLHLRVSTDLQINRHIRGIYVCMVTTGMMERCRIVNFSRASRGRLLNEQVNIKDDCLEVRSGEDVHVTLKTWPHICDVAVYRSYKVPGCRNSDIQRSVPECITGRIQYDVDVEKKELSVSVSDMLEDKDYQLRLCHKGYICTGTGAQAVVEKENPMKKVILKYSKPVPCLCIEVSKDYPVTGVKSMLNVLREYKENKDKREQQLLFSTSRNSFKTLRKLFQGWSVMMDAPRVQVCPFKDRVEELWSGITFDPVEETLSWEAACQVDATVTLCELQEGGVCQELAGSSQTIVKRKVTYSAVDPHHRLCMKFITKAEAWVKCPFSEGNFPAWEVTTQEGLRQLLVTSRVKTSLSLSKCAKTGAHECEDMETTVVEVEKFQTAKPDLTMDFCEPSVCIKAKRADVKYGVTTLYCPPPCSLLVSKSEGDDSEWQLMHVVVPVVALTTALIVVTVVTGIAMTVFQIKRRMKAAGIARLPGPHTDSFSSVTEASNSKTQLSKSVLFDICGSGSSQLKCGESSSLLNDSTKLLVEA